MTSDYSELMLEELRRMRGLLELMAEPAIAQRDAKLRDALRQIVGSSAKGQSSVMLMDGTRTQTQIAGESRIHQGQLSTMVGKLQEGGLLADGKKKPRLAISLPKDFFGAPQNPKRR